MPNGTICTAIDELRLLGFTYTDDDGNVYHRVVEPYAYGRTSSGNDALRAYQTAGTSESRLPGWKLFLLENMSNLVISESTFAGSAPGYAHGDKALRPIYCRVP